MYKPALTNFADFIEKPKPVIPKSKYEVQSDINMYLNIALFMVIVIGGIYLYQRLNEKKLNELKKQNTIIGFHQYVKEKIK